MAAFRFPVLTLIALGLSACSYLDMSTASQLDKLNPLTADPGDFTVYLSLPEGVDIPRGAAQLGFKGTRSDTGDSVGDDYTLDKRKLPDGTQAYRIAEADLAPMRAAQAQMREWKDEVGRAASGSLSISMQPCLTGAALDPAAPIHVELALEEGGTRMPLITGLPISEFLKQTESGNFLPCDDL